MHLTYRSTFYVKCTVKKETFGRYVSVHLKFLGNFDLPAEEQYEGADKSLAL
jgi:hypothetical protein